MSVADAAVSGGVTLGTLLISWAVKALFSRGRDEAAGHKDNSDAFARERETWRLDYDHAYNQLKSQCDRCSSELKTCTSELLKVKTSVHEMLDTFEDQLIPMVGMSGVDPADTRRAMRFAVRTARVAI